MKFPAKIFILASLFLLTAGGAFAKPSPKVLADKIVVEKAERRMTLYHGKRVLKIYRVSLGREPVGPKTEQGDGKTPEGNYTIDAQNSNSSYHRALHISYPNAEDLRRAQARQVSAGGQIMIHGLPNAFPDFGSMQHLVDWTEGCIAVGNREIDEIWDLVPVGTPIQILP